MVPAILRDGVGHPGRYGVLVNYPGMSEQRIYDLAFGERNRLVYRGAVA
ncbi:hypothetical protein [Luethyella okanaganae]|uniref:Uncharacterized protein n=1 Tax=Luethyella okanaganae TaxID=69372 RepID=A0ABW1VJ80_9MICO